MELAASNGRRWKAWLKFSGLVVAGAAILHAWTPGDPEVVPFCVIRSVTGIPCPGCGMTRAAALFAKGELAASLQMHPLAPLFVLQILFLWALWALSIRARRPLNLSWIAWTIAFDSVALIVTWIVRQSAGVIP